ncbi:hypothetical protein [Streptomyces cucumeris]|uniref:hypothetical protein n=1 Tax=Streptomyces cucumeris TaxID=2962890 RepID=UPI003D70B868
MAMMTLPLDDQWLDRILDFAELPWSRQAHDDLLVRNGWLEEGPDGERLVPWMEMWPLAGEFDKGWHIALGEYPGCREEDAPPTAACDHHDCREDGSVMLPVAYSAFGVVDHDDEPIAPEDYWDLDTMGGGTWRPDAVEGDWEAEYRRVVALLRGRLGEPSALEPRDALDAERGLVWEHGEYLVTLFSGPEWFAYGKYEWIGVEVHPRD